MKRILMVAEITNKRIAIRVMKSEPHVLRAFEQNTNIEAANTMNMGMLLFMIVELYKFLYLHGIITHIIIPEDCGHHTYNHINNRYEECCLT